MQRYLYFVNLCISALVFAWQLLEVMNDIAMGEKKNMNLPGVKVDLPVLQELKTTSVLSGYCGTTCYCRLTRLMQCLC